MSRRVAFVVAQPAHLLSVLGLLQRYHPHILVVLRSTSPEGLVRGAIVSEALDEIGVTGHTTFLQIPEPNFFQNLIERNQQFHHATRMRILEWLRTIQPDSVYANAFELSDIPHDVVHYMVDLSVRDLRSEGHQIDNFEFPLSCQTSVGQPLQYMHFPSGSYSTYHLTPAQARTKQSIIDTAATRDKLIAEVRRQIPVLDTELYRLVPPDRDYAYPPAGVVRRYDARGRDAVDSGKYATAIKFETHFVPLVRALAASPSTTPTKKPSDH